MDHPDMLGRLLMPTPSLFDSAASRQHRDCRNYKISNEYAYIKGISCKMILPVLSYGSRGSESRLSPFDSATIRA
jgi:hypothetical protein